jgi:hypothetical protein
MAGIIKTVGSLFRFIGRNTRPLTTKPTSIPRVIPPTSVPKPSGPTVEELGNTVLQNPTIENVRKFLQTLPDRDFF